MRFEMARLVKVFITVSVVFVPGGVIRIESIWVSITLRSVLVILGMSVLLLALRFPDAAEKKYLGSVLLRLRQGVTRLATYNYPQKLDKGIRCMVAWKSSKGERRNVQPAKAI